MKKTPIKKPKATVEIKLDPKIQETVKNVTTELNRLCCLLELVIQKGITSSK